MLRVGHFFSYPSVLGSQLFESGAQPTLSALSWLRAVKACGAALLQASMADFYRKHTLQPKLGTNYFFFKYLLQMYLNTKYFQQMYLNIKNIDAF